MVMSIWDPPNQPPLRNRRGRENESDTSVLDLTLLVLILGAIGLVVYFLGPLLWAMWRSHR